MRRILGKGLSQLVGEQFESNVTEVPIDRISPNLRQPRSTFEARSLNELAESIKKFGVIQPLLVRPTGEDTYELIAGERRLRAAKIARLETVPILIRHAGSQDSLELALIENVQREDINPVEAARAYKRLVDEFNLTQEIVSERVGKSRAAVANTMRLLKLPKRILDGVVDGAVTEGHARALLAFESEAQQLAFFDLIVRKKLSVREVEKATQQTVRKQTETPKASNPNLAAIEDALSGRLGAPVQIGKEKIVISFYSADDLNRILELLDIQL